MKPTKLTNRVGRLGWILTAALIAAAWAPSGASAQVLNTLVTFNGTDGSLPEDLGSLAADASGDLFGTTAAGGTSAACASGCGTVFEIKVDTTSATGYATTPTTLINFNGTDGADPSGGLIIDAHGNLFGTTAAGGTSTACGAGGCGTIFEVKVDSTTATGYASTPTTLAIFDGADGGPDVFAGLVADANGNLFGTTLVGGLPYKFFGTVFELKVNSTTATGYATTPTTLVVFDQTNGQYPNATLLLDASENLFGTTTFGGANTGCLPVGVCGTVFEIKTDSTSATGYASSPTTLFTFNGSDGAYPESTLIADAHGNLFGTTILGGPSTACTVLINSISTPVGCGTVFEIKTDSTTATGYAATPTTLVSFNSTDGQAPIAGLIEDANGNLFGATSGPCALDTIIQPSCPSEFGTVFEIMTDSTTTTGYASAPTTLFTFNGLDGAFPSDVMIADAHGNLFGTAYAGGTLSGGAFGSGIVFELTGSGFVPFVPPVAFAGTPGKPNCHGVTISTLARTYGGIAHAAMSLKYASVAALQNAVKAYCGN